MPSSTVSYRRQLPEQMNILNGIATMQQWDKKFSKETKNFSYHVELSEENRGITAESSWRDLQFSPPRWICDIRDKGALTQK